MRVTLSFVPIELNIHRLSGQQGYIALRPTGIKRNMAFCDVTLQAAVSWFDSRHHDSVGKSQTAYQ